MSRSCWSDRCARPRSTRRRGRRHAARPPREHGGHTAIVHGGERISHDELAERVARLAHGLAGTRDRPGRSGRAGHARHAGVRRSASSPSPACGAVAVPLNPHFKEAELALLHARLRRPRGDRGRATRRALCRELVSAWDAASRSSPPVSGPGRVTVESLIAGARADGARGRRGPTTTSSSSTRPAAPAAQARSAHPGAAARRGRQPRRDARPRPRPTSSSARSRCSTATAWDPACSPRCAAGRPWSSSRTPTRSCSSATTRSRSLERERVTVLPAVPFILRLLAEAPGHGDLSGVRLCFSAAAALPRPTFDGVRSTASACPIRQLYGSTEAGAVTANVDDDPAATWRSVGRPLAGVEIEVLDAGRRRRSRPGTSARSPSAARP